MFAGVSSVSIIGWTSSELHHDICALDNNIPIYSTLINDQFSFFGGKGLINDHSINLKTM